LDLGGPVPPAQHPKRHLDRFSRFCRAHDSVRQTDKPTDRPRSPSVTIGRIYVILRCGLKAKFHYAIQVADLVGSGCRPVASWNVAYQALVR